MKMSSKLTNDVLLYQKMLLDKSSSLKERASLYLKICNECRCIFYTYPVKIRILDEEQAVELLFSMEGRLRHLIEDFSFTTLPFDHYVKRVAYLQAQIFLRKQAKEKRRYDSLVRTVEDLEQIQIADEPLSYHPQKLSWNSDSEICRQLKKRIRSNPTFKRRFLQLVLKCVDELHSSHIPFLAKFLDMNEKELARIISETYAQSQKKRERTNELIAIKNRHFSDREFLRRELLILKEINAEPILIERVEKKLNRCEYNFSCALNELASRPNPVTHTVLAKLTNVPKGTVDSGMHSIKKILNRLIDAP
ncbi:MAG: hypothetical protein WDA17_01565 [Sphaerochaetaceae bacterium]